LQLQPTKGGIVRCTLRIDQFETTSFRALSYIWGSGGPDSIRDSGLTRTIQVNDKLFDIHQNLGDFLEIAQQSFVKTDIWIDAISITQTDINERNHQVRQMADNYSNASEVFA
jgi:Heterokaryon incompatibility protein (HET)